MRKPQYMALSPQNNFVWLDNRNAKGMNYYNSTMKGKSYS